ncbi:MAG: energy transducer TonB, partial [Ramlibacter sp.]|nr:energy transducer TonB [Ramlibacter sp.]
MGVVAAHALLLGQLFTGNVAPPLPVQPPALIGHLVPRPFAAPTQPNPPPAAPKPEPQAAKRPAPAKAPAPAPSMTPDTPVSDRAVAPVTTAAEQAAPTAAGPAAAPAAAPAVPPATGPVAAAPGPAPVTPPRVDAAHLNNPAPAYPALSRRFGEQGQVLLDVHILPDGRVG